MDHNGGGNSSSEHTSVNAKKREKRTYHRHTFQQTQRLEAYFKECPNPEESQRLSLGEELNLEPDQIKFWFQNKRTQNKTQIERNANILLREENKKIKCENEAMLEALRIVTCPDCGGPPLGVERDHNFQNLGLANTFLTEKRDELANTVSMNQHQQNMVNLFASVQGQQIFDTHTSYGTIPNSLMNDPSNSVGSSTSQDIQLQLISQMDITQLSETATRAVEELKRLFVTEDLWVMSSIDGTYVIDQESYEKFSHSIKHFRKLSARVESSKDVTLVPIEATNLIEMFLDSEKWERLFPTIVAKAMTIHKLGSELPINENCNNLQVIWEKLHILSPLVPPREFMIVRCCQKIDEGIWIVADVSQRIVDSDQINPFCYKRPSGCLIRAFPGAHSEVTWIEHVEVDHKPDAHWLYRELLCGGSGYGAKRWTTTLERMCERMALSSIRTIPATDWSEAIATVEGRMSVMKLGERMVKNFNEMLAMSGKVDFPQQSKCGVRISIRMNHDSGQPSGLVVSAASSFSVPITPLQVFDSLLNNETRHQWDVLCYRSAVSVTARILTGSNENNYITILLPTQREDDVISMSQGPKRNMMMLQECYMDALGGMIVYAPLDMASMSLATSGEVDPLKIPILSSGFTISNDGRRSMVAEEGGTILTVVFQILVSEDKRISGLNEQSVDTVTSLISSTVRNIKLLLNCPLE
ncbi:PREDICTED: homeobox-leucine zipper protein HDG8-like [Brassica oleracea var. oleracea]|uniref:homeobox-leucine zipper protein HDG8-like n=1 Tax=Brassica oleracea var. oleracea TaxID=109376 RepID=UPI0006A7014D|nr:PREDICTED: homeobox-leucine zipper protein HDG8-like [Brassica oleracea var. oleracea]